MHCHWVIIAYTCVYYYHDSICTAVMQTHLKDNKQDIIKYEKKRYYNVRCMLREHNGTLQTSRNRVRKCQFHRFRVTRCSF